MSHQSSVINSLREFPTSNTTRAEHLIFLIDAEAPQPLEPNESQHYGEEPARNNSGATASQPPTPGPSLLVKRISTNSSQVRQGFKRKITERKYAKYTQDRYDVEGVPKPPDEAPASQPQPGEPATVVQKSYLERSTAKAKAMLNRKKGMGRGKDTDDMVVEVLYENQRGTFFFGVPKYSSSSLLPSDPKPWLNAQLRTSPVDIRNAQVPDPSWEWAWKSWYVDMSRDVDEEGWEYSLKFSGKSSWHGNHPWFHSFVRRRRWLRMRRRRNLHHHQTREKAHELTADYFTIHPKTIRPASEDMSRLATSEMAMLRLRLEEQPAVADMEITDIAQLIGVLKKATVDREKLVAVRKFAAEGGEELYYLADRIPDIMSLFVFQSSRRQLLADLIRHQDEAHKRRQSLRQHVHDNDEDAQNDHDAANRHATNLMNAVEAADAQVKKLEYWSDIKGMAQEGDTMHKTKGGKDGWDSEKWAGLTAPSGAYNEAFMSKQDASAGTPRLHKHAEHGTDSNNNSQEAQESKMEVERSNMWDRFFPKKDPKRKSADKDAQSEEPSSSAPASKRSFEAPPLERFTTAAEDVSEIPFKPENSTATRTASSHPESPEEASHQPSNINLTISETLDGTNDFPRTRSVQLVEPLREPDEDDDKDGVGGGS